MNAENILKVADAIEQEAFGFKFDQAIFCMVPEGLRTDKEKSFNGGCGSVACIMGMASLIIAGGDAARVTTMHKDYVHGKHISSDSIQEWLGLDYNDYYNLYYAEGRDYTAYPTMMDVPKELAVRVLRNLAATGVVDWNV